MEADYAYRWDFCDNTGGGESKGKQFAFCGLNTASEPYCVGFVPRERTDRSYEYDYAANKRKYPSKSRFALGLRVEGDALIVKQKSRYLPKPFEAILGRHPLDAASDRRFSDVY